MTKKDLSKLALQLNTGDTGLVTKGALLFISPVRGVLRGISLGRSGGRQHFYATVFLQILCVLSEHTYYNIGWRLGGGSHVWDAADPQVTGTLRAVIIREAMPFLQSIETLRDAALAAKRMGGAVDSASQRQIAYAFARNNDTPQAIRELDRFIQLCNGDDRRFVREQRDEALTLRNQLLDDPGRAMQQLQDWEHQTLVAIGLERFAR
jgi:hypothetical protein